MTQPDNTNGRALKTQALVEIFSEADLVAQLKRLEEIAPTEAQLFQERKSSMRPLHEYLLKIGVGQREIDEMKKFRPELSLHPKDVKRFCGLRNKIGAVIYNGDGVYIHGVNGTGKTMLAVDLIKRIVEIKLTKAEEPRGIIFEIAGVMLKNVADFDSDINWLERYASCNVLVIDNLEGNETRLIPMLVKRFAAKKFFIATGTLAPVQYDNDMRDLRDRLKCCHVFATLGTSQRKTITEL